MNHKRVSEYALRRAIENTGIVEIEKEIGRLIISSKRQLPENIDELNEYVNLEGVYSRKRRTKNPANYSGRINWICKKCKQINGEEQSCLYCKAPNVKWRAV